jgi:hypothetical protein
MRRFPYHIILLPLLIAHAAEGMAELKAGYRLSGLVISTEGRNLAFIELPDGKQLLVREGDTVGEDGEVLAINHHSLRIHFPKSEEVLYLKGYNHSSTTKDVVKMQSSQIVLKSEDIGTLMNREVAVDALLSVFKEQKITIEKGKIADLSTYLAPLLNLPPKARIVGINHTPINSVKEALEVIFEGMANGNVVKLNLDGGEQIYLMPHVQQ